MIEARHSYGDIRKQLGNYEDYDAMKARDREYAY